MLWLLGNEQEDDTEGSILMEDGIWSKLPQEILFAILAHLPLFSFLRFRSVCKQWNALLGNPSSSLFFPSPPAFYNKPFAIFKTALFPASLAEHEIQTSLQQQIRRDRVQFSWRRFELDFLLPSDHLVSSHAGLVLIRRTHTRYLVCNPLLRVWTELPQPPVESKFFTLIGIFRKNPTSNSFKVILGLCHPPLNPVGESLPSFLYDSSIREWKDISRSPFLLIPIIENNGALCKNIYYWCTLTLDLLAFDLERETWHILETRGVPESIPTMYHTLCEWKHRLIMIAQDYLGVSILILSVDNRWYEFDSGTLDAIADRFIGFQCICMGDILLFHDCPNNKVFAYNLVSKDFHIISHVAANDSSLISQSFLTFHPSLEAMDSHSS